MRTDLAKLGLMLFILACAAVGGLAYAPFLPALVYHGFAVLRPQYIWNDALPDSIPWSLAAAGLAIVAAFVSRIGYRIAPHRFPGVVLPSFHFGHLTLGLFAFWITLTYLNAERPDMADDVYADYRKIFLMFFVTCLVMVNVRQAWALFLVVTGSLMYIAFEINEIYLLNGRMNFLTRVGFANLDNNGAGLMLAMGFPLCVYAWDGIRHWVRWVFPVGALLIVHAVLLSYSRGAMLSLLLTSPLYLLRCRNRKAILAAYLIGVALVPVLASEEISKRFLSIGEHEQDDSAKSRKTTWTIAARMAAERPLLGYGPRNSSLYTHRFGADEEGRVIHSTYFQLAADSGFVGLGLYVIFLGAGVYYANRTRIAVKTEAKADDPAARRAYAIACGVEGSILVFAIGCTFLSMETFEPPYILAMLGIQVWSIVRTASIFIPRCQMNALVPAPPISFRARPSGSLASVPRWTRKVSTPTVPAYMVAPRPIRVGFVVHAMQVAGAEVLVRETIRRLGPRIEPTVLCLDSVGQIGEELRASGVPVVCLNRQAGRDYGVAWRLAREARRRSIQVVHAHQYTPFFYAALARVLSVNAFRLILTEHGRHYPDVVSPVRRGMNRLALNHLADAVNACCEFSARALCRIDGFPGHRVKVIENGIDPGPYSSAKPTDEIRKQLGLAPDRRYVVTIARFHPVKDHPTLLRSFAEVARTRPDVDLLLAGDGPTRPDLERLAAGLGIIDRVRFLGIRRDVPDLLSTAEVFAPDLGQ